MFADYVYSILVGGCIVGFVLCQVWHEVLMRTCADYGKLDAGLQRVVRSQAMRASYEAVLALVLVKWLIIDALIKETPLADTENGVANVVRTCAILLSSMYLVEFGHRQLPVVSWVHHIGVFFGTSLVIDAFNPYTRDDVCYFLTICIVGFFVLLEFPLHGAMPLYRLFARATWLPRLFRAITWYIGLLTVAQFAILAAYYVRKFHLYTSTFARAVLPVMYFALWLPAQLYGWYVISSVLRVKIAARKRETDESAATTELDSVEIPEPTAAIVTITAVPIGSSAAAARATTTDTETGTGTVVTVVAIHTD